VVPIPFHFLDNNHAINVRPKNYSWTELYDRVIDLRRHSFSWSAIGRRLRANRGALARSLNLVRAMSSEGFGRIRYDSHLRGLLDSDSSLRRFLDGESALLPAFYTDHVRRDLGPFWASLPDGALSHDPNAYLKSQAERPLRLERRAAAPAEGAV